MFQWDEDRRTSRDYMECGATCTGTTASQWGRGYIAIVGAISCGGYWKMLFYIAIVGAISSVGYWKMLFCMHWNIAYI